MIKPKFVRFLWILLQICLPVSVYLAILVIRKPPVPIRPLSIYARFNTSITPLILLVTSTFVLWLVRRLAGSAQRLPYTQGISWTRALFGLALSGLWASGQSDGGALGGLLPWSDNGSYYINSLRLIAGGDITGMATRRHTGTVTAENLGFCLGMLSFSLLWNSAALRKRLMALLGIGTLTLALLIRPGALFTLPALTVSSLVRFTRLYWLCEPSHSEKDTHSGLVFNCSGPLYPANPLNPQSHHTETTGPISKPYLSGRIKNCANRVLQRILSAIGKRARNLFRLGPLLTR